MGKRKTTAEFIEDAKKVHGDLYDYSKVEYLGNLKKVIIGCQVHGEFEQSPKMHVKGQACPKCGLLKRNNLLRKTIEQFIKESHKKHNNIYDYSKVVYLNTNTKVVIVCKIHGEFQKIPKEHLKGSGCQKCGVLKRSNSLRMTNKEFIEKANQVHKNQYDYSKSVYINNHTKIIIICKEHGEFEQTPNAHLQNHDCLKCGNKIMKLKTRKTTKQFIQESKNIHGDKYDYSLVDYTGNKNKVKIICKEHRIFEQLAQDHIRGRGCAKCVGTAKLTTVEFIAKAIKIHGQLFDYSQVEYITTMDKVKIICKIHGIFQQTPNAHLGGNKCPKCYGLYKTTEEFIIEAEYIHGETYDYSLSKYTKAMNITQIICKKHGVFEQTAINHLKGAGCRKCAGQERTTTNIVDLFIHVHGNLYDYSKVNFTRNRDKVKIICKEHGEFEQTPDGHLRGQGCMKCSGKESLTTITFIEKAKSKNLDIQYDYSLSKYINSKTKIEIRCIEHNVTFQQLPSSHLKGYRGCSKCQKLYKGEEKIRTYLDDRYIFSECQKSFDGLKYINSLSCDFYLKDENTIIEFDGVQHYQSVEHFGGNIGFQKTRNRDIEKNLFAEKEKKRLLRIIDKSELNEDGKIELEKQKEIYKNSEFIEFIILNNLDELDSILDKKLNISKYKIKKVEKLGQLHFEF